MYFEFFENLRTKPKEVRKRYAFLFTSACTFVVVLVWVISLFLTTIGTRGVKDETATSANIANEEVTSTSLFKDSNAFIDNQEGNKFSNENWVQELQKIDEKALDKNNIPADTVQATSSQGTNTTGNQSIFSE